MRRRALLLGFCAIGALGTVGVALSVLAQDTYPSRRRYIRDDIARWIRLATERHIELE